MTLKLYDLEDRTSEFAEAVNNYVNQLPKTISNIENGKQLVRSAGSIGANYIEANESLSKKDFIHRLKISKKEAKETCYWLKLSKPQQAFENNRIALIDEATQLMNILGSIIVKSK